MARSRAVLAMAAVAVVAAGVGVVVARAGDSLRHPHGPGDAAAYAESVLDLMPLPTGASRYIGAVPGELAHVVSDAQIDTKVDHHRIYRVHAPQATLFSQIKARGIPGFQLNGLGGGAPSGEPPTWTWIEYWQLGRPSAINSSELQISTTAMGPDWSLLRIDAVVVPQPQRTAAEHVPASERVITIDRTVYKDLGQGPPDRQHRVLGDRRTVSGLIGLFNGLPTAPPRRVSAGPAGCYDGVEFTIAFSKTATATPDLIAELSYECIARAQTPSTIEVTHRGRRADFVSACQQPRGLLRPGLSPAGLRQRERACPPQPALRDERGAFLAAVMAALQG